MLQDTNPLRDLGAQSASGDMCDNSHVQITGDAQHQGDKG